MREAFLKITPFPRSDQNYDHLILTPCFKRVDSVNLLGYLHSCDNNNHVQQIAQRNNKGLKGQSVYRELLVQGEYT